jgi:hypothetical protein
MLKYTLFLVVLVAAICTKCLGATNTTPEIASRTWVSNYVAGLNFGSTMTNVLDCSKTQMIYTNLAPAWDVNYYVTGWSTNLLSTFRADAAQRSFTNTVSGTYLLTHSGSIERDGSLNSRRGYSIFISTNNAGMASYYVYLNTNEWYASFSISKILTIASNTTIECYAAENSSGSTAAFGTNFYGRHINFTASRLY